MNEATRGYIESVIDEIMEHELLSSVDWVADEIPISSLRDLLLGYAIGSLDAALIGIVSQRTRSKVSDEDMEAIMTILKRRLPEIIEKINIELNV